ncbi:MAG TPA: glycosyltransferase, partial [Vicinamibacteria bacterium]|nr:glycosyltransferase [Vicinamibacteria bacterium]
MLAEVPRLVSRVIVVDNGSRDGTARVAEDAGAKVVYEPRRGYGRACLAGITAAEDAEILAFLDADHSDYPAQLVDILAP